MDQTKYYRTNAFYLSVFLLAKNFALESVEKAGNKSVFVFQNSNKLERLVRVFSFGEEDDPEVMVNFKKVERAIKKLKSLIYD